ncbi:MAG: hypothetical protein ABSF34_06410, partial [Verrucomicrobiota bacterium]
EFKYVVMPEYGWDSPSYPNQDPDSGNRFFAAYSQTLPLVNFKHEEAEALAQKIRNVLEPQGTWVQYSYQIHKLRSRGSSTFKLRASKIVWFNLPPARVSVFQK